MTKETKLRRRHFLAGAIAAGPALSAAAQPATPQLTGGATPGTTAAPGAAATLRCRQVWVEDHGADPSGLTSSSPALNAIAAAYPAGDAEINFGPGIFRLSETWTPSCAAIRGAGKGATTIKPASSVARKALSIGGAHHPRYIGGLDIDMSNTSGSTVGIYFGDSTPIAIVAESLQVLHAPGPGIRIGDVLKSKFLAITSYGCNIGLLVQQTTSSLPTTTHFDSCVFTNSATYGCKILIGYQIGFLNCDFESSQNEGCYVAPTVGDVTELVLQQCWFEDNWGALSGASREAQFHFKTTATSRTARPIVRDCYFATGSGLARAIQLDGAGTVAAIVENPRLASAPLGNEIKISNSAAGEGLGQIHNGNWRDSVDDPNNYFILPASAPPRTWMPTVGATTGSVRSTTLTTTNYTYRGRSSTKLNVDIKTTPSSNTQYITFTLPIGLTPTVGSVLGCQLLLNGAATKTSGLMYVAPKEGRVYVSRADGALFSAGVDVQFRGAPDYSW